MAFKRAAGSMPAKRATKKAKTSLASLSKKVAKISKSIEHKNKDYSLRESSPIAGDVSGNYSPSGEVTHLSDIAQGDSSDQREGRRVMISSLLMRMHLRTAEIANPGTQPALPTHRNIIIWDKYPNGVLPTVGEILDFSGVINGDEALAPMNMDNVDRFRVLFDDTNGFRKLGVDSDSHSTNTSTNVYVTRDTTINKFIDVNQGVSIFKDAASIPQTGALYWVSVGNRWGSTTNGPAYVINTTMRLKYTDA